jgi:hypothetical protein
MPPDSGGWTRSSTIPRATVSLFCDLFLVFFEPAHIDWQNVWARVLSRGGREDPCLACIASMRGARILALLGAFRLHFLGILAICGFIFCLLRLRLVVPCASACKPKWACRPRNVAWMQHSLACSSEVPIAGACRDTNLHKFRDPSSTLYVHALLRSEPGLRMHAER